MMRESVRRAYLVVAAEVSAALGPSRINKDATPVRSRDDRGEHWRVSGVWFPHGRNRGFGVNDYNRYVIVRAWAHDGSGTLSTSIPNAVMRAWTHDGSIGDIELTCHGEPDETLFRWCAQAVGLLPRTEGQA